MNRYLLDTNVALVALSDPKRLSATIRKALSGGSNVLSAVSYWEVLIKSAKVTLKVGDPMSWWREALDQLAATPLPLRPDHVARLHNLPEHHKDPFDRAMRPHAYL